LKKVLYRDDNTGGVDLNIDPKKSAGDLCLVMGVLAEVLGHVQRRPRQRTFQVHRRGRALDGDHAQPRPAKGRDRQDWRERFRRRTTTVCTRWSKPQMAACSALTTRAQNWGAREQRKYAAGSALSTYADITADPSRKTWSTAKMFGFYKSTDGGKTWEQVRGGDSQRYLD